jgi:alkylation response protein AidB-like acyl-CoA dehydrogenase
MTSALRRIPDQTTADVLNAVRDAVPDLQAHTAASDRDGVFPRLALDRLIDLGALAAFGRLDVEPLDLFEALRLVGRANLSLGRIFEGHVNGAQLVAAYGDSRQRARLAQDLDAGFVYGVWNTEPAPGVAIVEGPSGGRLQGAKSFATGAGHIDRAVVTGRTATGDRRMVVVDAGQAERADPSIWAVSGMKATVSGLYDLTDLPAGEAERLGGPGDYEREPRFSGGAWRFTAVQLGGIERILQLLRTHLVEGPASEDPIHRARFAQALAESRSAYLWVRQAAQRAEAPDAGEAALAFVLMTRGVVEEAGLAVTEAAARSVGTRAFFHDQPLDAACRDLALYLRQPVPDQARDRAAKAFLAADAWADDPLW